MDFTANQAELFPFPTIEAQARKRSPLREMMAAIEEHGPLLPLHFIPIAIDVSKQRVHQLVSAGRIGTLAIAGKTYVPMTALDLFLSEERSNGRPTHDWRNQSLGKIVRDTRKYLREK